MNYLLDTHVFLWFLEGDPLPYTVEAIIKDQDNKVFLSIASIWEIAIKINLGKLKITIGFDKLKELLISYDIELLPITFEHLSKLLQLPHSHRDPFDRLIIAQAISNDLTVLTKDEKFKNYPVKINW